MSVRRVGLIALVLIVLLVAAGGVAAAILFDPAALKARAADAVRRATGRELTIAGPVGLAWSLSPTVTLGDVALANPPGFSRPAMATLRRLEVQVALWPLLSRRVEVRSLSLVGLDVLLERDAAARANWQWDAPAAVPGPAPGQPSGGARVPVIVDAVRVQDGQVGWRSAGGTVLLAVPDVQAQRAADGRVSVAGQVALGGRSFKLSGVADPAGRGPLALDVAGDEASAVETIPGGRVDRLKVAAPSSEGPAELALVGLWHGVPVAVAVKLGGLAVGVAGGPVPVDVTVAVAGAAVTGQGTVDAVARVVDMVVSARVPDLSALGQLAGSALPPLRDVQMDGRVTTTAAGALAIRGLRLAIPGSDVAGDVVLAAGPRPSIRGTLVSQRLDLAAVMARPAPAPAPAPAVVPAAPGPAMPTPPTADAPLPWEALRRADADVRWVANELVWNGAVLRAAEARVLLAEGRLRLDPVQAQAAGGPVTGSVIADAGAMTLAVALQAQGVPAGPVLAPLGAPDGTAGTMDVDVQLRGAGASLRAMVATLDGSVGAALVDGEAENRWLLGLFGDALRGVPVDRGGRSTVRCLALRFDVAKGQATSRAMVLDASRLRLEGEGRLSLLEEMLDLQLRLLLKVGGTSVSVPVRLQGPWRAPRPEVGRGGGALVIGAGATPDPCPAALTAARDGRPGPMPAILAEPARPMRPADLLRSLIR